MRTVDDIDPEYAYQMGLRIQKLMSDVLNKEISDEEVGQRVRAFVRDEGPHAAGMIAQLLWDRLRAPEYEAGEEDEEDDEGEDEIVDCPSCGQAIEAGDKGVPDGPCPRCGLDFRTGKLPCAGCGKYMMPDAPGALIVETKKDGQKTYHGPCAPTEDVVGTAKTARHPEKTA